MVQQLIGFVLRSLHSESVLDGEAGRIEAVAGPLRQEIMDKAAEIATLMGRPTQADVVSADAVGYAAWCRWCCKCNSRLHNCRH